jgi:hypothetical protein
MGGTYDCSCDPYVAFDHNGTAWYSHISKNNSSGGAGGVYVNKSMDGGATWLPSPLVVTQNGPGNNQIFWDDKPSLACDIGSVSPYVNNVYVSWARIHYSPPGANTQILFSRLVPGQTTFSSPIQISGNANEQGTSTAVGPAGVIYVAWMNWTSNSIMINRSTDGGNAFGTDQTVASVSRVDSLISPKHIVANSNPSTAVDNSGGIYNGCVYVVWADARNGRPDIYLAVGTPNGYSLQWRPAKRVNSDPAGQKDHWFPSVCVGPDGILHIML